MKTTSVLSKFVLPSVEHLNSDCASGSFCAVASAGSSHRPHKGFRDELVYHPDWAANIVLRSRLGYDSSPLAYRAFRNATLFRDFGAVIDSEGRFIEDTIAAARFRDPTLLSLENARLRASNSRSLVSETCLFSGHGPYCVFGHFMLETMVSIFALNPLIKSNTIKIIMPPGRKNWPHELLDAIGVPRNARVGLDDPATQFRKLIVATTCSGDTTFCPNILVRKFADAIRLQVPESKTKLRLYLTRSGASTTSARSLNNEAALISALHSLGFMAVEPGRLPFPKQVALFSQAELIIGLHGSAFANVIFAREGCIVGEILPDYWAAIGGLWIGNLTNLSDLDYFYIIGKSEKRGGGYVVEVDVDVVVDRVRKALNSVTT